MTARREEAKFKETLEALIADFQRRAADNAPAAYLGAANDAVLEHTARKHFLDKLLEALGWDISHFEHDVVEEARVHDDTTVFLDYVGAHPEHRTPLMIFEAKAWEEPLVTPSDATLAKRTAKGRPSRAELIAMALAHCKANEDEAQCPVSLEWRGWLLKLIQYVTGMKTQSRHMVSRVAISSGQWIVVFYDPSNAFVDAGVANAAEIFVYRIEDYVKESDEIYAALARENLILAPPPYIGPAQISAHLSAKAAKKLYLGVWVRRVSTGSPFDVHPQILVYPAVLVQRSDEEIVTIVDRGLGYEALPNDSELIADHLDAVTERSGRLLATVRQSLPGLPQPSSVLDFPGFVRPPSRAAPSARGFEHDGGGKDYLRPFQPASGQYVLVTGEIPHFILAAPRVATCGGHDWAICKKVNENIGEQPIVGRSVDPASFFISTEMHHCAHRQIHGRRSAHCKIQAFENYLCCQVCTFQPVCWGGVNDLPCGMADPDAPSVPPEPAAEPVLVT
jgi:hypothetical protein